jgi:hypothetical protein
MHFRVPCHLVEFEIPDGWWLRSGMADFSLSGKCFCYSEEPRRPATIIVPFSEVQPPIRDPHVQLLFEERTVSILSAFCSAERLPPLWVVLLPSSPCKYRVHNGYHRYYCSAAAGFSHLPVFVETPLDLKGEFDL